MEVFCFLTCKLRVYFRYKPDFFSQAQIPVQNKVTLLVVREGIPITVITYYCVSACFLSVAISQ